MNATERTHDLLSRLAFIRPEDAKAVIEAVFQETERDIIERCAQIAFVTSQKYHEKARRTSLDDIQTCLDIAYTLEEVAEEIRALKDNC